MESKIDAVVEKWGLKADKKRMFGGACWMLEGNMMCAILSGGMVIARVPNALRETTLRMDHVYQAEMNGRIMKNWVMFDGDVVSEQDFERLLEIGRDFALSLRV